ncbi:winged helix-turn-helix transcriptional regulator [Nonomuraea sp. KC401]|uniref:winged helix-turn-helix domain-containing protein n=1 Tax=unclassified Nonomuraea TaxID=2593643 RepID=UPI0010FED1DA|nr:MULTISPECIES: winged helix-turn-helix domain-containing protein [unclassified Nonomuraea]NBE99997.1 GntR family transcriptional regulator [Nonomuraea sp. K271]TLF54493.1 winged helix-turn-helix transcriptional regulator [Nonomuraea sp. KC401]
MVKNTGRPGYLQIADDLRAQIRGGSLAPGTPLPSTTRLAEQYDASLSVVKLAVGVLRTEGLVIGQQGKGVFVRDTTEQPPPAGGDTAGEVAELRAAVQDLSDRLAKVEEQLATSTTRRPGRSSR